MSKAENHRMPRKEAWGTPAGVIDAVTAFMGGIDMDPASDDAFNAVVGAAIHYTKADDGLIQPWFGRVFLNPPGGKRNGAVPWWNKLVSEHRAGNVSEACYLSFALDSFQWSQTDKCSDPILAFPTIVFAERLRFLSEGTLIPQKNPWKPCAITWLPQYGSERSIHDLATLLAALGHRGIVCTAQT